MVTVNTKRRKVLLALGVLAAVVTVAAVGWFGYWHIVDSRNPYGGHNSYGMRDYTPEVQQKAAEGIVAGLNTHNPDEVELLRFKGQPGLDATNSAIRANIAAVMPPPGCTYALDGIEDQGELEHPADLVPWYSDIVEHAWGFDMKLRQLCPGQPPQPRTIRVIAIGPAPGGFWNEAALR